MLTMKYTFIMTDIDVYGKYSDGGVFYSSKIHICLQNNSLKLLKPRCLPN